MILKYFYEMQYAWPVLQNILTAPLQQGKTYVLDYVLGNIEYFFITITLFMTWSRIVQSFTKNYY